MTDNLHEHQYMFGIIPAFILLRIRYFSDKFLWKIKMNILCPINFSPGNRVVSEVM